MNPDLKAGDFVSDRWWPWNVGVVESLTRSTVRVKFDSEIVVYDKAHQQFLEREPSLWRHR